jgi:alpha-L-rhamnosidase
LLRWSPTFPPKWFTSGARLFISGLGYFRVFVNGYAAGKSVLQPSWSNYNVTVPFVAFDISSMLSPSGNNTIDVLLGAGWWSVMPNLFWGKIDIRNSLPHGVPQARAILYLPPPNQHPSQPFHPHIESPASFAPALTIPMLPSTTIVTGSPVLFSSIHLGETYDASRDPNAGPWSAAVIPDISPAGSMQAETVPPIVVNREVPAVSMQHLGPFLCGDNQNPNGCWVVDFGENMAGIVRITIRGGVKGQLASMRFGELVHDDGSLNVNTSNNAWKDLGQCANITHRPGEQMDIVYLSGEQEQVWEPLFVYHGFRCVFHPHISFSKCACMYV